MNKDQWKQMYKYVIRKDLEAAENRTEIKQIYSWILRRDQESMKRFFDEKRAKSKDREVDLFRLYLNWNKLARGY